MSKVQVEWKTDEGWMSGSAKCEYTVNGNLKIKFRDKIYVFKDLKERTEVVTKENGKWVKVGRVSHGDIFLGEGLSYSEYSQTPEGIESSKKLLESLRAW